MPKSAKPLANLSANLGSKQQWLRGLAMLLFFFINYVLWLILILITIFQFIMNLVFKSSNKPLLQLGQSISIYSYEIIRFITYNSEQKPFPFDSWPRSSDEGEP